MRKRRWRWCSSSCSSHALSLRGSCPVLISPDKDRSRKSKRHHHRHRHRCYYYIFDNYSTIREVLRMKPLVWSLVDTVEPGAGSYQITQSPFGQLQGNRYPKPSPSAFPHYYYEFARFNQLQVQGFCKGSQRQISWFGSWSCKSRA